MELFLIDGIGPFFKGYRPGKRINWSKIPFDYLEKDGEADVQRLEQVTGDFKTFCGQAAAMGYNGVTLDDLAHMVPHPDYGESINRKIRVYAEYYRTWIDLAAEAGLQVYITTDFMFYTARSRQRIGSRFGPAVTWFRDLVRRCFEAYPGIAGLVLRIGEVDGKDVKGDFISRLIVHTPGQARKLLQTLVPECKAADRTLIFRLWSVGAYSVGDLLWNRKTLRRVVRGIDSKHLILSIKHGESDFFRYLPLNKQFFRTPHRKIVELQARREYEGCGEYPSYIGDDVQHCRDELRNVEGVIGMSVWCQTGGWTRFRRLTFLPSSSVWNEINTWMCIRIFRDGLSAPEAVQAYADRYLSREQGPDLLMLLQASDRVVKQLLYVDEYARRKMFFRRVRLPCALSVYWDRILILHSIRKLLNCFVEQPAEKITQGDRALTEIDRMRSLARSTGLPEDGLDFMYDTFRILAEARRYYFLPFDPDHMQFLQELIETYSRTYAVRYSVRLEFKVFKVRSRYLRMFLKALLRDKRGYRAFDHVVTVRFLGALYPLLRRMGGKALPDFMHRQAMGLEAVFK